MQDFSGKCRDDVRSCFVNAAIRNGGTARAVKAGVRIEVRDRRRRTVVVCMLTLLFMVGNGVPDGSFGSGRCRDLELNSISALSERA